mmetsp:Transcript_30065/g.48993  ORF Transcript_30065/g.48993 Transcript_30065/m.48993 type:complete len:259 (+) Transcript_30065:650-1426(+)
MQDTVGVDIKRHLNLRSSTRRRRHTHQIKMSQKLVIGSHVAFTLEHFDTDLCLIVSCRRERLRFLGRNRCILLDEARENAAQRLNTKRERRHINQDETVDFARQNTALNGSAHRHHLIRVHTLRRRSAKELLHHVLHFRHTRHTAHQKHVGNVRFRNVGIFDALLAWRHGALNQLVHQVFQLCAGHRHVEMFGSARRRRDKRSLHLRLGTRRQLNLGAFRLLLQTLHRKLVAHQVNLVLLLELATHKLENLVVKIFAA